MIVMKFGGTSVENAGAIGRLVNIVRERVGQRPVIVSSAMAKVTDTLLEAASTAAGGNQAQTLELMEQLKARHITAAQNLLTDSCVTRAKLLELFAELEFSLGAIGGLGELLPHLSDHVASFGERLSTVLVNAALRQSGIDSALVDARQCIVTDDRFTCAAPLIDETNRRVSGRLLPLLDARRVPVMGGFIAATTQGETTTLGRGGSDLTAALVASALCAERVEIWTDVDGICSADPRLYPPAQPIDVITFEEAAELAQRGAKVLHPATLIPAIEKNIPVYVLNSRNPQHPGTCVRADSTHNGGVKAVAVKRGITLVEVSAARAFRSTGFVREVFDNLEANGCAPDIASVSDSSVTLTVERKEVITRMRDHFRERVSIKAENSKAVVSLVGDDIRQIHGLPARVFSVLEDVHIWLASPGAAQRSLSFVISEKDVPEVLRRLHQFVIAGISAQQQNTLNPSISPAEQVPQHIPANQTS